MFTLRPVTADVQTRVTPQRIYPVDNQVASLLGCSPSDQTLSVVNILPNVLRP